MSAKVMGMVFDACLKPNEKLVLLALADHADHQGANIYPAVETIAKKSSLSERTTQRVLRDLEQQGVLIREKNGGGKRTNLWRIDLIVLAALHGSEVTESHPSGVRVTPQRCQSDTPAVSAVTPQRCQGDTPAVSAVTPDPSYNHPGTVPGTAAPPGAGGEAGAPEGAAGTRRAAASFQGVPESSKPTLGGAAEKPRGGRLSDPISDLIAYAAYSAPRGTKFTSVTANRLLKDRAGGGKPSAADAAALVSDLRAMYDWWTAERPTLSAPGKYESISRALSDWKRAKSKCGGLVYAPVLQPDGSYRMEWTHEVS